jgi:hypothetical protein
LCLRLVRHQNSHLDCAYSTLDDAHVAVGDLVGMPASASKPSTTEMTATSFVRSSSVTMAPYERLHLNKRQNAIRPTAAVDPPDVRCGR